MFERTRQVHFWATAVEGQVNDFMIHASIKNKPGKEPNQLESGSFKLKRRWGVPFGPWKICDLDKLKAEDGVDQELGARIWNNAKIQIEFGIYDRR